MNPQSPRWASPPWVVYTWPIWRSKEANLDCLKSWANGDALEMDAAMALTSKMHYFSVCKSSEIADMVHIRGMNFFQSNQKPNDVQLLLILCLKDGWSRQASKTDGTSRKQSSLTFLPSGRGMRKPDHLEMPTLGTVIRVVQM